VGINVCTSWLAGMLLVVLPAPCHRHCFVVGSCLRLCHDGGGIREKYAHTAVPFSRAGRGRLYLFNRPMVPLDRLKQVTLLGKVLSEKDGARLCSNHQGLHFAQNVRDIGANASTPELLIGGKLFSFP